MDDMTSPPITLDGALNADLHCHSIVSDGTLAPEVLAQRAKDNGVALWALTDHDEVDGVAAAAAAAHELGLPFLAGAELSASFAGETIHVVGLGFDPEDPALVAGLARTRAGRETRARAMGEDLARVGIPGAYEGALARAGNPQLVARTHFARFLVDRGVCRDNAEVFRKYLTEGKPGYVPHAWASLRDAVAWITGAGGVAVIAHPGRYKRLSATEEYALFIDFKALGGQGVEVVTGSHTREDAEKYGAMAGEFGLWASRGSDFHAPDESRVDLGRLPPLAATLDPVWAHLATRIRY